MMSYGFTFLPGYCMFYENITFQADNNIKALKAELPNYSTAKVRNLKW